MFPIPAPITPEPRPAERSVARWPGIVFTILTLVDAPPSCMSRKRRGLERASAALSAMKFAGNRVFCRSKLLDLPSPEIRFAPARRHASALLFRGTLRRMVDARTRRSARTLLIFERVSESKQRERLKQNKDHAE